MLNSFMFHWLDAFSCVSQAMMFGIIDRSLVRTGRSVYSAFIHSAYISQGVLLARPSKQKSKLHG